MADFDIHGALGNTVSNEVLLERTETADIQVAGSPRIQIRNDVSGRNLRVWAERTLTEDGHDLILIHISGTPRL